MTILVRALTLVFIFTNTIFAYQPETSFWEQRKLASLPLQFQPFQAPSIPDLEVPSYRPRFKSKYEKKFSSEIISSLPEGFFSHVQIRDAYQNKSNLNIVILEDVHANAEAQGHLSQIIKSFGDLPGESPVFVGLEGASGPFQYDQYKKFPHDVGKMVADSFFNTQEISGPAHAGYTSFRKPHTRGLFFWGVDDPYLYTRNLAAYTNTKELKSQKEHQLMGLNQATQKAKKNIFNGELLKFDRMAQQYSEGEMLLAEYINVLSQYDVIPTLNIEMFVQAHTLETKINFSQVDREKSTVIEKLIKKLDKTGLDNLINLSFYYQQGQISFSEYFKELKVWIQEMGLDLKQTPEFQKFLQYVLLSDGIKTEALFADVNELENQVYALLINNTQEKNLVRKSQIIRLSRSLIDFELTTSEWNQYKEIQHCCQALLPQMGLEMFEDFYVSAESRNKAMIENLLQGTKEQGPQSNLALLVAGGFHTEGLTRLLKDKGISYIVATPKITKIENSKGAHSLSIFDREKSSLEKIFIGKKLFLSPPPAGAVTPISSWGSDLTREIRYVATGLSGVTTFHDQGRKFIVRINQKLNPLFRLFTRKVVQRQVGSVVVFVFVVTPVWSVVTSFFSGIMETVDLYGVIPQVLSALGIAGVAASIFTKEPDPLYSGISPWIADKRGDPHRNEGDLMLEASRTLALLARDEKGPFGFYAGEDRQIEIINVRQNDRSVEFTYFDFNKNAEIGTAKFSFEHVSNDVTVHLTFEVLDSESELVGAIKEYLKSAAIQAKFIGNPDIEKLKIQLELLDSQIESLQGGELVNQKLNALERQYAQLEVDYLNLKNVGLGDLSSLIRKLNDEITSLPNGNQNKRNFLRLRLIKLKELSEKRAIRLSQGISGKTGIIAGGVILAIGLLTINLLNENILGEWKILMSIALTGLAMVHAGRSELDDEFKILFVEKTVLGRSKTFLSILKILNQVPTALLDGPRIKLNNIIEIHDLQISNESISFNFFNKTLNRNEASVQFSFSSSGKKLIVRGRVLLPESELAGKFFSNIKDVLGHEGIIETPDTRSQKSESKHKIKKAKKILKKVIPAIGKVKYVSDFYVGQGYPANDVLGDMVRWTKSGEIFISRGYLQWLENNKENSEIYNIPNGEDPLIYGLIIAILQASHQYQQWNRFEGEVVDGDRKHWQRVVTTRFSYTKGTPIQFLIRKFENDFKRDGLTTQHFYSAARQRGILHNELISVTQPQKIDRMELKIQMDNGTEQVFIAWRTKHETRFGATKGGIRIHPSVDESLIARLAIDMSAKSLLMDTPYGGAKGGIQANLSHLTTNEQARLIRTYVREMESRGGLDLSVDIPARELGMNDVRLLGWYLDEFIRIKQLQNQIDVVAHQMPTPFKNGDTVKYPADVSHLKWYVREFQAGRVKGTLLAAISGKTEYVDLQGEKIFLGGIPRRGDTAAHGAVAVIKESLKMRGEELKGRKIAIQGYGVLGQSLARILFEEGAIIIAISEAKGLVTDPRGIDIKRLQNHYNAQLANKKLTSPFLGYSGSKTTVVNTGTDSSSLSLFVEGAEIVIPAAVDGVLNEKNFSSIRPETRWIFEAANGAVTIEAEEGLESLRRKNNESPLTIVPDILVNGADIVASHLETLQNLGKITPLTQDEFEALMNEEMIRRTNEVLGYADLMGLSPRRAAYQIVVERYYERLDRPVAELPVPRVMEQKHVRELEDKLRAHQRILRDLQAELKNPGSVNFRKSIIITDEHGAIDKYDALLVDAIKSVLPQGRLPESFQLDPDKGLQEQLQKYGVTLDYLRDKLFVHNLGDFMDRGPFGIKVFNRSVELIRAKISDFVMGNHDFWMWMNLMAKHLPWYEGYNHHDYSDSYDASHGTVQDLTSKWLKENKELSDQDKKIWWAEKLAAHREFHEKKQKEVWDKFNDRIRGDEKTTGLYNEVLPLIKDNEKYKKLWDKLRGWYLVDVYTGTRAVGLVSIVWWEELLRDFKEGYQEFKSVSGPSTKWQRAISMIENEIIPELRNDLETHLDKGEWWWRVFESINSQNYTSTEWWAMDWLFHSGWGPTVLEEINKYFMPAGKKITPYNYLDPEYGAILFEVAEFFKNNFNLHIRDFSYLVDYTHGFLPIDLETGEFYFKYKGIEYRGKGSQQYPSVWKGLEEISKAVKNSGNPAEIKDELDLVNSWYADNTTKIKPPHVAAAIHKFGAENLAKINGSNFLFSGHLPFHEFRKASIAGADDLDEAEKADKLISSWLVNGRIGFADHGMGQRFEGRGGVVYISPNGVLLRGYPDKLATKIVDEPDTRNPEDRRPHFTNPKLPRDIFLPRLIEERKDEIARIEGELALLRNGPDHLNQIGMKRDGLIDNSTVIGLALVSGIIYMALNNPGQSTVFWVTAILGTSVIVKLRDYFGWKIKTDDEIREGHVQKLDRQWVHAVDLNARQQKAFRYITRKAPRATSLRVIDTDGKKLEKALGQGVRSLDFSNKGTEKRHRYLRYLLEAYKSNATEDIQLPDVPDGVKQRLITFHLGDRGINYVEEDLLTLKKIQEQATASMDIRINIIVYVHALESTNSVLELTRDNNMVLVLPVRMAGSYREFLKKATEYKSVNQFPALYAALDGNPDTELVVVTARPDLYEWDESLMSIRTLLTDITGSWVTITNRIRADLAASQAA